MAESLQIDVKEDNNDSDKEHSRTTRFNEKATSPETIVLIANFILELPSAVFDQLSSVHKTRYALLNTLISLTVLIISIIDLVYKGRKERVTWMKRGLLPWFYYPYPNSKPFGNFPDVIGLVCAIFQCIFATIAYAFLSRHTDNPIKVSVWPIIFAFGLLCSRLSANSPQRNPKPTPLVRILNRVEEFTLGELVAATDNFSLQNKIGVGSSGAFYKGRLSDGRRVAIKRVDTTQQRKKFEDEQSAFVSELAFLTRLHHKHLVRLVGYCEEYEERLLVYEHLNNGGLHDLLEGKRKNSSVINSWKMRIKIALEAARGIEYLHNYAVPPIIHGDIKSSNIVFDSNYTVRVVDFGFSMMGPESEHGYRSMEEAGTVGYIDPEYYTRNVLTTKSDVYSLGVVILELLTGKKAIFKDDDNEGLQTTLLDFAVPKILANELVGILDNRIGLPELANEAEAVEMVAYTALHCVNSEGNNRPNIRSIVANLEQALSLSHNTIVVSTQSSGRSERTKPKLLTKETEQHQLELSEKQQR